MALTSPTTIFERPLLLLDIDGVISLFGFDPAQPPRGSYHSIDGIPHFLAGEAGAHLHTLSEPYEQVWCSGWEEKANEYLPHLLGLPGPLPFLTFERAPGRADAHWKLAAIDAHAGHRALAWIDDAFNGACHEWARRRAAPTLLLATSPERGLQRKDVAELLAWADAQAGSSD